ncbi:hypothetical protein [Streptomyces graminofaciens]|nr:hypothetical protein [Streptomyces graminofaciens]
MTDSNRRAVRTAPQALLAVAAAVPLLADSPGVADLPGYATLVAAATALSRLMSIRTRPSRNTRGGDGPPPPHAHEPRAQSP